MLIHTGTWAPISGITAARDASLNGTVEADELVQVTFTHSGSPAIVLECQDRVVRSTADGHVHCYARVRRVLTNTTGRPVTLARVTRFPGEVATPSYAEVDVDWRPDGLGALAPKEGGLLGTDTSWRFAENQVGPEGTYFLYAKSHGTRFARDGRLDVVLTVPAGTLDANEVGVTAFRPL